MASKLDAWVVLPKCFAAATASPAICAALAVPGAFLALSDQTPASGVDVGCCTCVPFAPQVTVPLGTPSQYWLRIVPQLSCAPNRPLNRFCVSVATCAGSLLHCEPQNTRYTLGCGVTTPCVALDPTFSVAAAAGRTLPGWIGLTPKCPVGVAAHAGV